MTLPDELIQGIVLKIGGSWGDATPEDRQFFRSFAALVAAYEREECAKIADNNRHNVEMLTSFPLQSGAARHIAIVIRARGEK